jgi:hypothetical protein
MGGGAGLENVGFGFEKAVEEEEKEEAVAVEEEEEKEGFKGMMGFEGIGGVDLV